MGTEGIHLYGDRAPHNLQYVVLVASANLTQERVLTGTANQIVITDNGAGSTVVLSTPQDIHTGASPTFGGATFNGAVLIDGSANAVQLTVQAHSTQTADLHEWQDSAGNILAGIDERGILFSDGGIDNQSVFIGNNVGNTAATGTQSVGIGYIALTALTSGLYNIALGAAALNANTTGSQNVAIGRIGLYANTTGSNNFAIGTNALQACTTGSYNVAIGTSSLFTMTTGTQNVAIGWQSLKDIETSNENTAIGYNALVLSTAGDKNTAIGNSAGQNNLTGDSNIFLGYYAGFRNTESNTLLIDNRSRADEATEKTNAILYGIMAAAPADQSLRINANLYLPEVAAAAADIAAYGQLWVKNTTPCELWFTDDAGTDTQIV